MKKRYKLPAGVYYNLYADMLRQPHLLVAGATGSGKSVVINGIICTALYQSPADVAFILIDPKRVELAEYKTIQHVIKYASEPADMLQALNVALTITETRYKAMQRDGVRKWTGGAVYVIIDELADLMTTQKRAVQPLLQRLAQIGRAAKVHIIAATQCPLREVIPTAIKVNFDARVGLRTRSPQDSRNILNATGCEKLPRYGQGYYMTPEGLTLYNIPLIEDAERARLVNHWKPRRLFHRKTT